MKTCEVNSWESIEQRGKLAKMKVYEKESNFERKEVKYRIRREHSSREEEINCGVKTNFENITMTVSKMSEKFEWASDA